MNQKTMKKLAAAAVVAPAVVATSAAVAGTGGTEFNAVATTLVAWLEGGLGQVLALAAFGIGLAIGVAQQSVMAVIVGIVFALSVFYGPGLLTSIVGSSLPL